jgi:adenylate cyclase
VLIITGLGGIGKTTLLHRLAEYTLSESTLLKTGVVTLDFANEELRNDPLKLLDRLTKDTAPFCDVLQIDIDFKKLLQQNFDQLAQLSIERAQTGVSESEDLALREIHHQMRELATEAFYTQIKTCKLNQLVMMLDTCEWLNEPEGIEVGQWVLNELVPGLHTRIRKQGGQCHVVMVSRVQLKLDVINGRDQQRLTLPMLGKAEVDQYLEHMGMQDADLRQRVFEVTHGLALCVSIIGDFWQQREAQKEPFTIADLPELQVQEFSEKALMQFTNERILKQLKSPFKELTRYGVLLRSFDLPFLRNVFPELLPEDEALEIFNQLIRYPYIESRGNYRYTFKEESEEWKGYHKLALDYLTKVSPHSPDWYYHLLAYDEKQGLVEWQQAIKEAREKGKREFTGALLQAALDEALNLSPMVHAEISYEQGRFNYHGLQWEEALKSYNEGLVSFKEVEDYSGQAKVLQAIGDIQRTLEKQDEALASYGQALALYRQVGDQLGEAMSCQALGDVQRLHQDLDTALHSYEQCLDLFQQLKERSEEAKALEAIGDVQRLRNNLDASLRYYEQALALFGELKEPVEEANVRHAMEEILEFDKELPLVMDEVIDVVKAERGFLVLLNPATNKLEFKIARDKQQRTIDQSEFAYQISRSTVERVVHTQEPVLTDDVQIDDALMGQESIMAFGIRSIMCVPLVVRGNCIGAVYVDSRINANRFSAKHRDLLLAFCHQAAIAIANTRLFADLNITLQRVEEDKQYMDNIFASITNGVITTDSSGIITKFNDAAGMILQINPLSAVGKHYQEVFRLLPQLGLIELLQNAGVQHSHGTIVPHAVDCEIAGRGRVNLTFYVSSLHDNTQNVPIGMALVIDDRTELKRAEAKAKDIRRIFGRFVHPNVVQQLIDNPNVLNLDGETKEISVIAADFHAFTSHPERKSSKEVMNLLNTYLEFLVKEIWEEEGTVTRFWGDVLMAIFNAPLPQEDHVLRAVRAAWKIRLAILDYQRTQPQDSIYSFGIGVNTGEAIVGNIGSRDRIQNYTAIGDVVNIAARLQAEAKDNNNLLNHSTFTRVRQLVRVTKLPPQFVKNESEPLDVWNLVGWL